MKPFANLTDAPKIARQFVRNLIDELGADKVRLVAYRNSKQMHPNVCHSHDFCDANMIMDSAFIDCGFRTIGDEYDKEIPDDAELLKISDNNTPVWNAAWDIAKRASFDPDAILVVGSRVQSGTGDDYDTGAIAEFVSASVAIVAWDSHVKTRADVSTLRAIPG